ncbi:MAG TPA: Hsp20/alpha crystallin family protein [Hanamia sp.]|nr:Hsp20/alpha crystallin family protein [Hanamia sp.]
MENSFLYNTSRSVYPGEYVPLFKESDLNEKIKHLPIKIDTLPMNITELPDSYHIEVAAPGVKRKNLLVNSYGDILSISVIHDNREPGNQGNFQLHEFNFVSINRKIKLPDNADPLFINSEYKEGTLHLHISKSNHPVKNINTSIATY